MSRATSKLMMKELEAFHFSQEQAEQELEEFRQLLSDNQELSERAEILPFFRQRPQLSSKLSELYPGNPFFTEKIAYEFDVFGDFKADLLLASRENFFFVEFEDAKSNSIFKNRKTKYKPEFSCRFETGFSQIIDWFYKLNGLQNSNDFLERFNYRHIHYEGLLIIGRSQFMSETEMNRLEWRVKRVVTDSKHINCITYDQLYDMLREKMEYGKKISGLL